MSRERLREGGENRVTEKEKDTHKMKELPNLTLFPSSLQDKVKRIFEVELSRITP